MNFDVIFKNAEQRHLESSIISSWVKDKSPVIIKELSIGLLKAPFIESTLIIIKMLLMRLVLDIQKHSFTWR